MCTVRTNQIGLNIDTPIRDKEQIITSGYTKRVFYFEINIDVAL